MRSQFHINLILNNSSDEMRSIKKTSRKEIIGRPSEFVRVEDEKYFENDVGQPKGLILISPKMGKDEK